MPSAVLGCEKSRKACTPGFAFFNSKSATNGAGFSGMTSFFFFSFRYCTYSLSGLPLTLEHEMLLLGAFRDAASSDILTSSLRRLPHTALPTVIPCSAFRSQFKKHLAKERLLCLPLAAGSHSTVLALYYTPYQFSSVAQSCPALCDPMDTYYGLWLNDHLLRGDLLS